MNGPQHYREAERIAKALVDGKDKGRWLTADDVARYAAAGELHARLATVAAALRPAQTAGRTVATDREWSTAVKGGEGT